MQVMQISTQTNSQPLSIAALPITPLSINPSPTNPLPINVATFYKFVALDNYVDMKPSLLAFCIEQKIKGTVLLAAEGINATIAGPSSGIDQVLAYLREDARLADLEHKLSFAEDYPFYRMKVKLKKEIVTMGVPAINPAEEAGEYMNAEEWNTLISDEQTLVVDTRNDYEVDLGTFDGAVHFNMKSFRELPALKTKILELMRKHKKSKLAMFCTGGIRCEKSTAFMKQQGIEQVYHLQGGILKYLEQVPVKDSLWQGDCFVFDNRVSVNHQLAEGNYQQCFACRHPITREDMAHAHYRKGISCPYCYNKTSAKTLARVSERQKQMDLAKTRHREHMGITLTEAKACCNKKHHNTTHKSA